MDGRFAPGKLHDFRMAFRLYEMIQDAFDFFQSQVEACSGIGKAQRTVHVAGAVHFDDPQAGMLLVLGTQTAVKRTAALDLGGIIKGDCARLVEF